MEQELRREQIDLLCDLISIMEKVESDLISIMEKVESHLSLISDCHREDRVQPKMNHEGGIFGKVTYAQHMDDGHLIAAFKLIGIDQPSYLDIGAHHPWNISNTALMYLRGSRGVNVEANPLLYQLFKLERPDDRNINVGVTPGGYAGLEMEFYMIDEGSGLNTFCPDELKRIGLVHNKTVKIPVCNINDIVDIYCNGIWPDLLNTDIEGLDHEVLESATFMDPNRPKIICSEIRPHASGPTISLLCQRGYFLLTRCMANLIFVDQKFRALFYT